MKKIIINARRCVYEFRTEQCFGAPQTRDRRGLLGTNRYEQIRKFVSLVAIPLACSMLLSACTEIDAAPSQLAMLVQPGQEKQNQDTEPAKPQAALARVGAAPIELETVGNESFQIRWQFLGQVNPVLATDLAAAVPGHIVSVEVNEGDRAEQGDVLVRLDSSRVRAELAAAKARRSGARQERKLAKRQFRRVRTLSFPTVSPAERESYQREVIRLDTQYDIHSAEVQRLQVALAYHTVKAPFAGVIRDVRAMPGAWLSVGQPVLGLVSLDLLEIQVDVSAELGARIAVGSQATLLGPTEAAAEVTGVVGALDDDTKTIRVRLLPKERPNWLVAGMTIDVGFALDVSGQQNTATVSRDAVIQGPVSSRVIKYQNGKAIPIPVEILATSESHALIDSEEIQVGDQVIVRGNERLRPGQPLRVINDNDEAQTP